MDLDGFSYMKVMNRNKEKSIQTCSCRFLYGAGGHSMASCPAAASLSLLFPLPPPLYSSSLPNGGRELDDDKSVDGFPSVDCTLSLRTPSAHQTMAASSHAGNVVSSSASPSTSSCSAASNSKLCWTALHSKQQQVQTSGAHAGSLGVSPSSHRSGTTAGGRGSSNKVGVTTDTLLARRCANCDTTSTPLWRNGPRGPKSLCNACGIRYKKEERRAIVTTERNDQNDYSSPWAYARQLHGHPTEFRLVNNGDHEAEMVAGQKKCLSWRLNLSSEFPPGDRTNLVRDMT